MGQIYEVDGKRYEIGDEPSTLTKVANKAMSLSPVGVGANIKNAANVQTAGPLGVGANPKDRLHLGAKALKGASAGVVNVLGNQMVRTLSGNAAGMTVAPSVAAPIAIGAGVMATQPEQTTIAGLPGGSMAMGANAITDLTNLGGAVFNSHPALDAVKSVLPPLEGNLKRPFRSIDDYLPKAKTAEGAVAGQVLDLGLSMAVPTVANAYTNSLVSKIAQREDAVIRTQSAYDKFRDESGGDIAELKALHKNRVDSLTQLNAEATGPVVRSIHDVDNNFLRNTQPILLRAREEGKAYIKTQNKVFDKGMEEALKAGGGGQLNPATGETEELAQALESAIGNAREMQEKGVKITEGQRQILKTIDALNGVEAGEKGQVSIEPLTDIKSIWDSMHKKFSVESADWAIGKAKNAFSKFLADPARGRLGAVKFREMYGALADRRDAIYDFLSPYNSALDTQSNLLQMRNLVQAGSTTEGVAPVAHDIGNFIEDTKGVFPELYAHIKGTTEARRQASIVGSHLAAQTEEKIALANAEHAEDLKKAMELNNETRDRLVAAVQNAKTAAEKAFHHEALMRWTKKLLAPVVAGYLAHKGWKLGEGKKEGNTGGTGG